MGKIEDEMVIVEKMIRLYCRNKHNNADMCDDCLQIRNYAFERLTKCPFGDNKSACKNCKVHCYKSDSRQKIREIMRYSGPRMLIYHSKYFFQHYIAKKTDKVD